MYGMVYYLLTTLLAVMLGITLVLFIRPGSDAAASSALTPVQDASLQPQGNVVDSLMDIIRSHALFYLQLEILTDSLNFYPTLSEQ